MIPRLRPSLGLAEYAAAFVPRYAVPDFERSFAALVGQGDAIAYPYGRTALMALISALGIKGKEIICPAYTCVVVAHAIVLSGNTPVFVDSEPNGFNMDLDLAEAAVTPRTGALIATSIHGYPVDLWRLHRLNIGAPHVAIIQDCAHSFAAEFEGEPVNRAGVAAIFGLNVSKMVTSVFGGMITTDDASLAKRLRGERATLLGTSPWQAPKRALYLLAAGTALSPLFFGLVDRIRRAGLIDRFIEYYSDDRIDMPADHLVQIGKTEASVGVVQCGRYHEIVAHRRKIAAIYDEALSPFRAVERPPLVEGATYSHYVIRVADPQELLDHAARQGLELGRLIDYCIPDMPAYRDLVSAGTEFPRTRELNRTVVNLPVWVDQGTAQRVAGRCGNLLKTIAG